MYSESFKFLSQKMDKGEIIDLLKSIYEHSAWVPERLLSQNISEIKTKEELQLMMQNIVDNASEIEKLNHLSLVQEALDLKLVVRGHL